MSHDAGKSPEGRKFLWFVVARLVVLAVIASLLLFGYVTYVMLDHGNVRQAVFTSDFTAVRGFFLIQPPSDEQLRELLHVALCNNQFGMAEYLLDKGADPNMPVREGYFPPLTEYLAQCWPDADRDYYVKLLVSHGARMEVEHAILLGDAANYVPNLKANPALLEQRFGDAGFTLLHFAAAAGQYETAKYLIQGGADVDARTQMGQQTARDLAEGKQHWDVVQLLS